MLKVLVIVVAIMLAVVNVSAKPGSGKSKSPKRASVVHVGPTTTYLQEGLTREQVVRLLGEPTTASELGKKELLVTRYEFERAEGRILIAEFVNDALVSSRTETREHLAQAVR